MIAAARRVALTLIVTALALPAAAQDWRGTQGRLEGRVVDPQGQPVAGATIKLELPGRGGTTLKTDKKGKWAIGGIAAGRWNIDIEAEGFVTIKTYQELSSEFDRKAPMEIKLEKAVDPMAGISALLESGNAAFDAGRYAEARAEYGKLLADPKLAGQKDALKNLHIRSARALAQEMKIITLEMFEQLENAMPYSKVADALRAPGTERPGATGGKVFDWKNPDGSGLSVTFTGLKLEAKAQNGLKSGKGQPTYQQYVENELDHLEKALALDPADPNLPAIMAQEALAAGLADRALALLSKLDPATVRDPTVFFNVGVLFLNQGKTDDAVAYFTKSIAVDPKYTDGYFQRGLAYLGQQKIAESKADLAKVVELAPGTPEAETAKKALESLK